MQISGDYNSNLAYDLSRFDVAEQEKQNKHRKEEQEKAKQEIRMNSRSVSRSGSRIKLLLSVGVLFGAFWLLNCQMTKADDWARMVSDQNAALTAAQEENALLQSKLESMMNIGYIEEYASKQLGMAKVSNAQVQYLSVNTENLIEVYAEEDSGFLSGVNKWFSDLLEYIGL
ncbi:MAG: hypothetical protein ACI4KA_00895 [Oscillospiraceae bacterium]